MFAAFLKCPVKCWLRSQTTTVEDNPYARWFQERAAAYRAGGAGRLASGAETEVVAQTVDDRTGHRFESRLDAVEHIPSAGRGSPAQAVPVRFHFLNKPGRDESLLLGFDALALTGKGRCTSTHGKLVYGDDYAVKKVRIAELAGEVRRRIGQMAVLLSGTASPELVLNRHCAECGFQRHCRQKAVEQDSLSLLAGMGERERQRLRGKGIFTVTQLSHTFQPRRKPRWLQGRAEKYHHALKALAIRERKIHLVGRPELKIEGTPVYLDVEGLPDRDCYYLIGLRIGSGAAARQHSLWADTDRAEEKIWREFLAVLNTVERPVLIHYGSYETSFLKRMRARHGEPEPGSPAAGAMESALNLVSVIFARIYFPTFSNGLKEIAQYLGFSWSVPEASGVQSVVWRETWSRAPASSERERRNLIAYNADDCAALEVVTQRILDLAATLPPDVVDAAGLKRENPYGFKRNRFFFPELATINQAAYWDYQREKVYVKSDRRLRRALIKVPAGSIRDVPVNRRVQCAAPTQCPHCGLSSLRKYDRASRTVYDLKFTRGGLRRWVVHYHYHRHECRHCGRVFRPPAAGLPDGKFGPALMAYAVYQNIELRLSQEMIDRSLDELFGLPLAQGSASRFKIKAAQVYAATYELLLRRLRHGGLLHVDETKVSVAGCQGCVWVFASLDTVAYVYTQNRESEWLRDFLKNFQGVLVTDFYSGYDALECPKQRCLIHFLRDLNDDLYKHPYDEELKRVGRDFADLVRPMIATVERRGLKVRFLKKHRRAVDRFYRRLDLAPPGSAVLKKYRERFARERGELFTFLHHDGVPWNNNNAEHAIKAFALLRQVINGVTSEKGLREYLVLLSVCETCKYQGVKFLDFLRSGEQDIHRFATPR
ncbi:IS66 family transposase [Termitidicoccus mucosus]|uniref:IS66 family transposase n=1 Tax=Termitidicoccus mucosus TaxID=1184151 RepID=UPI002FEE2A17